MNSFANLHLTNGIALKCYQFEMLTFVALTRSAWFCFGSIEYSAWIRIRIKKTSLEIILFQTRNIWIHSANITGLLNLVFYLWFYDIESLFISEIHWLKKSGYLMILSLYLHEIILKNKLFELDLSCEWLNFNEGILYIFIEINSVYSFILNCNP